MVIDQLSAGRQVEMAVGAVAEIRLPENPTTGYRWAVVADGAPVCAIASIGFQPDGAAPGQGGQHSWQLRAIQVGQCDIAMQPRRSFDSGAPASQGFTLHVLVNP